MAESICRVTPIQTRDLTTGSACGLGQTMDHECIDCPLAGRHVVMVGGLERMEPAYRDVVNQLGGRLFYHSGHVKTRDKQLKQLVKNADMVVFFTSVNSHGALTLVKKACRKTGATFMAVKETGASSLKKRLCDEAGKNFLPYY